MKRRILGENNFALTNPYKLFVERNKYAYLALDLVSETKNIVRIYPSSILCDEISNGKCRTILNGKSLYYDDDHLSNFGASLLNPILTPFWKKNKCIIIKKYLKIMSKYNCLICNTETRNFKNWNNYRINICETCKFSFIKTSKADNNEVFSPSEKKFYENAISGDKEREKLFTNNIVKNRINFYQKLLKRKPLNILEVGCGTAAISEGFLKNGIEYSGIELDENIYKFAISKSRNVIFGDFLKTNFKNKFDVLLQVRL